MKFGRFKQPAQELANKLIEIEKKTVEDPTEITSVSVKVKVSTAGMLSALAEAFGQSRYAFGGEVLEDFTSDLFLSLPEERRALIAVRADSITTDLLKKQGITGTSHCALGEIDGDATWQIVNHHSKEISNYNEAA